ncbi:MAG: hypothetical protein M1828_000337 [Chrysothrix sp. TS-e1954]|nr:MAG: hypothetical protein M1828_000337 [Chrysothrix sp. TS-e1954]
MAEASPSGSSQSIVRLRPARAGDLPYLAQIHIDAHVEDPLHVQLMPGQFKHPYHAYVGKLLMFRKTYYSNPTARYIVAENEVGNPIGFAAWNVINSCPLAVRWKDEHKQVTRFPGVQGRLLKLEGDYWQYCVDRASDQAVYRDFIKAMEGNYKDLKEHIYCMALGVDPKWQRKGVGKQLLRWGKDLARQEGLPIALTSSPVGYSMYIKEGFSEYMITRSLNLDVPVLLWEPEEHKGDWLATDEEGKTTLKPLL